MKKILTTLAAAGLMLSSGAALAQDNTFDAVDADGNGEISWSEFSLAIESADQATFDLADADGDGFLDEAEFNALEIETGAIGGTLGGADVQPLPESLSPADEVDD
jgi:hypothetical protein